MNIIQPAFNETHLFSDKKAHDQEPIPRWNSQAHKASDDHNIHTGNDTAND